MRLSDCSAGAVQYPQLPATCRHLDSYLIIVVNEKVCPHEVLSARRSRSFILSLICSSPYLIKSPLSSPLSLLHCPPIH
jgi:hypothetical protein